MCLLFFSRFGGWGPGLGVRDSGLEGSDRGFYLAGLG